MRLRLLLMFFSLCTSNIFARLLNVKNTGNQDVHIRAYAVGHAFSTPKAKKTSKVYTIKPGKTTTVDYEPEGVQSSRLITILYSKNSKIFPDVLKAKEYKKYSKKTAEWFEDRAFATGRKMKKVVTIK